MPKQSLFGVYTRHFCCVTDKKSDFDFTVTSFFIWHAVCNIELRKQLLPSSNNRINRIKNKYNNYGKNYWN